jgi:hypothetical protein
VDSYRTQSNGSGGKAYQTAVPRVRLVYGVGIVMAELLDYFLDAIMVLLGNGVADKAFESASRLSGSG